MSTKLSMALILALIILVIARTLAKRNANLASRLNLDDLLLGEDGKISKSAAMLLGAFVIASWQQIYLTLAGKIDPTFAGLYMGIFASPFITKLIANRPSPPGE